MNHKCMPICFWCTKEKGTPIELPEKNGKKPPKKAILNYEPCKSCKEMFDKGIHIIGVKDKPLVESMPPIMKDKRVELYPTGSYFVATPEWTKQMLLANEKGDLVDNVLERKVLMMPEEIVSKILEEAKGVPAVALPTLDIMEEDDEDDNN